MNILTNENILENVSNDNNTQFEFEFEFDFAMCHGSYCCCCGK